MLFDMCAFAIINFMRKIERKLQKYLNFDQFNSTWYGRFMIIHNNEYTLWSETSTGGSIILTNR